MGFPAFRAGEADPGTAVAPPRPVRLQQPRRIKPSLEQGGDAQAVVQRRMLLAQAIVPREQHAAVLQPFGFQAVQPRQRPLHQLQRGRVGDRLLVELSCPK